MNSITYHPTSAAYMDYEHSLCPVDAHIHITPRGVWANADKSVVVRCFSLLGVTHWTRETWTHDNGWACTLDILTKSEFLQSIRS